MNLWHMVRMGVVFGLLSFGSIGVAGAQATSESVGVARHWVSQRGQAVDLALTPSGDAWALDSAGQVWRLPKAEPGAAANTSWSKQPGQFRRLRATQDGTLWGIGAKGTLYRLVGSLWRPVRDAVRDVASSPDGIVWVLLEKGQLVRLGDGVPFIPAPPANRSQSQSLLADEHGLPWLVYSDKSVTRFDGVNWRGVATSADRLQSIAIGLDGTVLAVNTSGQLLRWRARDGRWLPYDDVVGIPAARQVAVAADGLPWIVSGKGQVFAERPLNEESAPAPRTPALFTRLLTWQQMGANALQVSVSADGTVFSIAPDGTAWRWNGETNWSPLNGKFRMLVAGDHGKGWALDESNRLRQLDNGLWRELSATALYITADSKNILWGIQRNGDLVKWDEAAQRWQVTTVLPVRAQALAIGTAGEPWLVDEAGAVMVQQAGKWTPVRGIVARSLGIGPEGTVYATTKDDEIFWLDRREMEWKPATGKARLIAVGPSGAPWAITPNRQLLASGIFLKEKAEKVEAARVAEAALNPPKPVITIVAPTPSQTKALSYTTLAGNIVLRDVGIGGNGAVYAAGSDGGLYCFSNPDTRFNLASSGANQRIAVAPSGAVWVVSTNGVVSRFENRQWVSVPEFTAKDVAVGPDGQVWAAGIDGQSYLYNASSARFGMVSVTQSDKIFTARRVAGANAGVLWVVTDDSQLMRCEKGVCHLALSAASDISVAPDNTVFALDGLGKLQRYDARTKAFSAVNGQGISLTVGPQGLPWLVNASGQIQYAGLIYPGSKTVNTASCAQQFAAAQTPVALPSTSLKAVNDTATLAPGGMLDLLINDTYSGRQATLNDVTLSLEPGGTGLTLNGSTITVPSSATAGTLTASYKICPKLGYATCASAQVTITVVTAATVPGAPTSVVATSSSTTSVSVSFAAPASNGGAAITSYTVTSAPDAITASGAASPINVTGLANDGTPYTFTVAATNSVGTGAASSASNSVRPGFPGMPTNVTATAAGVGSITVSFTPGDLGGGTLNWHTVTCNPGTVIQNDFSNSPITFVGLTTGVSYSCTVYTENSYGAIGPVSNPSNSVVAP